MVGSKYRAKWKGRLNTRMEHSFRRTEREKNEVIFFFSVLYKCVDILTDSPKRQNISIDWPSYFLFALVIQAFHSFQVACFSFLMVSGVIATSQQHSSSVSYLHFLKLGGARSPINPSPSLEQWYINHLHGSLENKRQFPRWQNHLLQQMQYFFAHFIKSVGLSSFLSGFSPNFESNKDLMSTK